MTPETAEGVAGGLVAVACADDGALLHYILHGVLGLSVVASALANLRRLPAPLLALVDAAALNFVTPAPKKDSPP